MNVMKRMVCVMVGLWVIRSAAAAAAPVPCSATGAVASDPAAAAVRTVIDPATKLAIRVEQPSRDVLIVSVADGKTSIRKEFRSGDVVTTIRNGGRAATITMHGDEVIVSDSNGKKRGTVSKQEGLAQAVGVIGTSTVIRAGSELLDRLALQADTFEGNALLLTRALLAAAHGDRSSTVEHQQWARWRTTQPRVVRVQNGPGDCWDKYAAEAIRIMNDYIDCISSCTWYSVFCESGCGALYDIRAEMAFLWYFNCNGPFYRE
jgi:hypothetical protein